MDEWLRIFPSIDKKMIPIKIHYFLFNAATAPFALFGTTMAKQLGYSAIAVGAIFTILPIITILLKGIFCYTSDKYRLRKTVFQTTLLVNLLADLLMIFMPARNINATVQLTCDAADNNRLHFSSCVTDYKFPPNLNNFSITEEGTQCRLSCLNNDQFHYQLCSVWKVQQYCSVTDHPAPDQKTTRNTFSFSTGIYFLHLTKNQECLNVDMSDVHFTQDNVTLKTPECEPTSADVANTSCNVTCNNPVFMGFLNPQDYTVFFENKFWMLLLLFVTFSSSMVINICLTDTACLELLDDDIEAYGFTRLYAAVGWGTSSLFGGWLTDKISGNSEIKNYTPLLMSASLFMVCDLFLSPYIEILQPKQSSNALRDIGELFLNVRIITFTVCCCYIGLSTALIWQFLFWHLEDISTPDDLKWSKTLQGLISIVGTFLSEIPIVMFSGLIIKRLGHINTISVVLIGLSVRMLLYSSLKKVIWTLPIELLSGVTFGLFYTDMTSYANLIAPPGTEATVLSIFSSAFDGIGISLGSLIGGFMYDKYKGAIMYFVFSVLSFLVFCIHILTKLITPDVVKTP